MSVIFILSLVAHRRLGESVFLSPPLASKPCCGGRALTATQVPSVASNLLLTQVCIAAKTCTLNLALSLSRDFSLLAGTQAHVAHKTAATTAKQAYGRTHAGNRCSLRLVHGRAHAQGAQPSATPRRAARPTHMCTQIRQAVRATNRAAQSLSKL